MDMEPALSEFECCEVLKTQLRKQVEAFQMLSSLTPDLSSTIFIESLESVVGIVDDDIPIKKSPLAIKMEDKDDKVEIWEKIKEHNSDLTQPCDLEVIDIEPVNPIPTPTKVKIEKVEKIETMLELEQENFTRKRKARAQKSHDVLQNNQNGRPKRIRRMPSKYLSSDVTVQNPSKNYKTESTLEPKVSLERISLPSNNSFPVTPSNIKNEKQDHVVEKRATAAEVDTKIEKLRSRRLRGTNTTYKCLVCGRIFPRRIAITTHVRRVHFRERENCYNCHEWFYNRQALFKHRRLCLIRSELVSQNNNFKIILV